MSKLRVIAYGNPADGFSFVGPFDDYEECDQYAERALRDEDYWFIDLEPPREEVR